jgi:hypothetical protein
MAARQAMLRMVWLRVLCGPETLTPLWRRHRVLENRLLKGLACWLHKCLRRPDGKLERKASLSLSVWWSAPDLLQGCGRLVRRLPGMLWV